MDQEQKRKDALSVIKKAYNEQEFDELGDLLAKDAVLDSQWVSKKVRGKDQIVNYYNLKMGKVVSNFSPVKAESAMLKNEENKGEPCLIVTQKLDRELTTVLLTKVDDQGEITDILLCIPRNYEWVLEEDQ